MSKGHSIVGSSRQNGEREKDDFYPTPTYAIEKLLEVEEFEPIVWEPACGDGAISKVLAKTFAPNSCGGAGYKTVSSDIVDRGYGEHLGEDFDFLKLTTPASLNPLLQGDFDIITNPPFKYGLQFVLQAKKFATNKIAMFLKLSFLAGVERKKILYSDRNFPLARVYIFSGRVPIWKNGIPCKNSGMIDFAWFVWDKNHKGQPTFDWI